MCIAILQLWWLQMVWGCVFFPEFGLVCFQGLFLGGDGGGGFRVTVRVRVFVFFFFFAGFMVTVSSGGGFWMWPR